jgi:hypothetical protein
MTNYAAQTQPQVYSEAQSSYLMPLQMSESLGQFGAPTTPNSSFVNAPSLQIQPANLIGATANAQQAQQQTYEDQLAQNNAMMSGLFGIPTAILGGWAQGGGVQKLLGSMALA